MKSVVININFSLRKYFKQIFKMTLMCDTSMSRVLGKGGKKENLKTKCLKKKIIIGAKDKLQGIKKDTIVFV